MLLGAGHVHVVVAGGDLARGVTELPQRPHEPLRGEDPEHRGGRDPDQDADHQRLGDGVGDLPPQRAAVALAHHRALTAHHLVEERRGEGAHDEEGGEPAEHRDQHVRQDEPGCETVHEATSMGEGRNL